MVWYPGSGVPTASSQPFVKVLRSSDQTCRLFRAARSLLAAGGSHAYLAAIIVGRQVRR